jgi:hypothetical protein
MAAQSPSLDVPAGFVSRIRLEIARFLFRSAAGDSREALAYKRIFEITHEELVRLGILDLPADAFRPAERWQPVAWIAGAAAAGAAGLIAYSAWYQMISLTSAASLVTLATALSISSVLFVRGIEHDGHLSFESHWGGLGGGLGGWRISSSVVFLLTTAILLAAFLYAVDAAGQPAVRERYRAAINFGESKGMRFSKRYVAYGKLWLVGSPPKDKDKDDAAVVNQFWDQVKLANPAYNDIVVDLTQAAPPKPAPKQETKSEPE